MSTIAVEQYLEDAVAQNSYNAEDNSSPEMRRSIADAVVESEDGSSGGFDCNICLDSVQEPVVTLCGHLYCWPCIYKWLHLQTISTDDQDKQPQQQCPVCKSEVSQDTLVPLYGRGPTKPSSKSKAHNLGIIIPRRPLGLACGIESPSSHYATGSPRRSQQIYHRNYTRQSQLYYSQPGDYSNSSTPNPGSPASNLFEPMTGVFGEMIYPRVFGSSITNMYTYTNSYHLAGITSPRVRRHLMQADMSLSRICFFLFCCVVLCFLLF